MNNDVRIDTRDISIISFEDEDGNIVYDVDEDKLDITPSDNEYIYITDEGEGSIKEAHRFATFGDDSSGVYINTPKNFSWTTIGTGIVFLATILFNLFSLYEKQTKFNERTEETLQRHRDDISLIRDNMTTRKEEDLKFQNVDIQIKRLEQLIEATKGDVDRLDRNK